MEINQIFDLRILPYFKSKGTDTLYRSIGLNYQYDEGEILKLQKYVNTKYPIPRNQEPISILIWQALGLYMGHLVIHSFTGAEWANKDKKLFAVSVKIPGGSGNINELHCYPFMKILKYVNMNRKEENLIIWFQGLQLQITGGMDLSKSKPMEWQKVGPNMVARSIPVDEVSENFRAWMDPR